MQLGRRHLIGGRRGGRLLVPLTAGGWVAGAGASGAQPGGMPVAGNYVGAVQGTGALLAIVVGKTSVVAYMCDSRTIASHFEGGRRGSVFRLLAPIAYPGRGYCGRLGTIRSLRPSGAVTFTLTRRGLGGTVTIGGKAHRFIPRRAPAWAGYFRAEGAMKGGSVYAGWVVAPNASSAGPS